MTAPDSVVAVVQEAMGCEPFWATRCAEPHGECLNEEHDGWDERGCDVAVRLADAAWAVAYPAALRDAAERIECPVERNIAGWSGEVANRLRRWADESEEPK